MKNIPQKIYLQIGDLTPEEINEIDFTSLSEVTWSIERIYDTDIEFKVQRSRNLPLPPLEGCIYEPPKSKPPHARLDNGSYVEDN